jgi:hypothetical protein
VPPSISASKPDLHGAHIESADGIPAGSRTGLSPQRMGLGSLPSPTSLLVKTLPQDEQATVDAALAQRTQSMFSLSR